MQAPKRTTNVKESVRAKARAEEPTAVPPAIDQSVLEAGRRAIGPRRKDAETVRQRVAALYGTGEGIAPIASLESKFQFAAAASDEDFLYLNVEGLLEQASRLLDQCAADRREWDALQREKWKTQVEWERFLRNGAAEQKAREAGAGTADYELAAYEESAERAIADNAKNAEDQMKWLLGELLSGGFNRQMAANELLHWISAYPLKDIELKGDDATYGFDGIRRSKADHLYEAARMQAEVQATEAVGTFLSRRYEMAGAAEGARLRKEARAAEARGAAAGITLAIQREQISADAMWEMAAQAQSADGPMNYASRIAPVEKRFLATMRDAVACLTAASKGMDAVYGVPMPLPAAGSAGYFEEALSWLTKAKARVAQFAGGDQEYVLALSVKDLAKGGWDSGKAAGSWTFDVGEDLFPNQAHVRLRGIGMAVSIPKPDPAAPATVGKNKTPVILPEIPKPQGFWSARVFPPATGSVRYLSGTAKEIDQKALQPCILGRVRYRDSAAAGEVGGAPALRNASPIGKGWRVAISPKSTGGDLVATLDDVELYLHVSVRGTK